MNESYWLSREDAWSWEASAAGRVPLDALFTFALSGQDPRGVLSPLQASGGAFFALCQRLEAPETRLELLRSLERAHEAAGVAPDLRAGVPPLLWSRVRAALALPHNDRHALPSDRPVGSPPRGARAGTWEEWWAWTEAPGASYDGDLWAWGVVRLRAGGPDGVPTSRAVWAPDGVWRLHPTLVVATTRASSTHAPPRAPPLDRGPGLLIAAIADAFASLTRRPIGPNGEPAVEMLRPSTLAVGWVSAWLPLVARTSSWPRSPLGAVTPASSPPLWSFGVAFLALHPRMQAALFAVDRVARETLGRSDLRLAQRRLQLPGEAGPALLAHCIAALDAAARIGASTEPGAAPMHSLLTAVASAPTLESMAAAWANVVRGPGVAVREIGRADRAAFGSAGEVALGSGGAHDGRLTVVDEHGERGLRAPDVRVRGLGWYGDGPSATLLIHTESGRLGAAGPGAAHIEMLDTGGVSAFAVDGTTLYTIEDGQLTRRDSLHGGATLLGPAEGTCLSAAGGRIVWADPSGRVWVLPGGRPTPLAERTGSFPGVNTLSVSAEGRVAIAGFTVAVCGLDGVVRVLPRQRHARVVAAEWSGDRLALGDLDGVVEVWRDRAAAGATHTAESATQAELVMDGHSGAVLALHWRSTEGGPSVCSVGADGTLRTWEALSEDTLAASIRRSFEELLTVPVGDRVIARYLADECWSRWMDPLFLPELA